MTSFCLPSDVPAGQSLVAKLAQLNLPQFGRLRPPAGQKSNLAVLDTISRFEIEPVLGTLAPPAPTRVRLPGYELDRRERTPPVLAEQVDKRCLRT
jgi:hypothetical protein